MSKEEAIEAARSRELDLVLIAEKSDPPVPPPPHPALPRPSLTHARPIPDPSPTQPRPQVCTIVSYDKWRFNREKGQKKQKKATKGQGAAAPRHTAPRDTSPQPTAPNTARPHPHRTASPRTARRPCPTTQPAHPPTSPPPRPPPATHAAQRLPTSPPPRPHLALTWPPATELKELKLSYKIGDHDFQVRA